MTQDPRHTHSVLPVEDLKKYAALYDRHRRAAIGDIKASIEFVRAYREFVDRRGFEDEAGPGAAIELVVHADRLIVTGRLAVVTGHVDRVRPHVEGAGGSIDSIEDDPRIDVSLLAVSGLDADALYTLVADMRALDEPGSEPLGVGLDDVTYENVNFKPVRPQSGSGAATRVAVSATRPRDTGRGAGVTIGVIDGGFEADGAPARTDGWFDNVIPPADGRPALNLNDPATLDPGAGHGTFVTGVIAGHAPDATIRQYRATDSWGLGSAWRLKDKILQAVDDGCQVINISLGFEDPELLGSPALSAVLHHTPSKVVIVAAAGNGGRAVPMLPASHKTVVGVGGLEADLDPVGWSNRGPWVDFSALAVPVLSTYVVDPAAADPDPNPFAVWAGTSFAAPKVTGEVAVLLGHGHDPVEAIDILRAGAARSQPSPDFGYVLDLPDQFGR